MQRNLYFCYFAEFFNISPTLFINKPDSLTDLTIFIISSIFLFDSISAVITDPQIFFSIAASVADAAGFNPKGSGIL